MVECNRSTLLGAGTEWLADLGQLTLGDEVWCKRLYATIVDREKGLSPTRGMSCAHTQLGYLYQIAAAPGWLDNKSREYGIVDGTVHAWNFLP